MTMILSGVVSPSFVGASTDVEIEESEFSPSYFRNHNYYRQLLAWESEYDRINLQEISWDWDMFVSFNPLVEFLRTEEYSSLQARLETEDEVSITINVPETGLYEIGIDFRVLETFHTIPTISVKINDEYPFNEASSLELEVAWDTVPLPEDRRYNRYGNELLPEVKAKTSWSKYYFDDYNDQVSGNYQFLLVSGDNEITLEAKNLPLAIGKVYVRGYRRIGTYAEYAAGIEGLESDTVGEMIVIEGESFISKNDLEIKSSYFKDSQMTPYAYKHTVLNRLDGSSMSRGGTMVTYEFTIEKAGFYQLGMKVLHNSNQGIVAGKTFYLDGEIPFKELEAYTFSTTKRWENVTLQGTDNVYWFYLAEGQHTLSIESTASQYVELIDTLHHVMDMINQIGLKIQTITGGNPDDALDWNLLKYLPTLETDLLGYADTIEAVYATILEMDEGMKSSPQASALLVAAKQLRRLAETPNRIGSKLAEFSEGSGSSYQLIGNVIGQLLNQPLSIDRIYFYNDVELPDANAHFFKRFWEGIKSFFYSFFDERYNQTKVDEDTLEVWVGQSSLYLDIIQSMIDEGFTNTTGIPVKCSIMTDASKIILSNATNDNPDVVLSLDTWVPYSYALRGMLTDLSEFPDFQSVAAHHIPNNFTTLIYEDGVYGIPETQSVYLLYYRKDIMNYLGLEIPDTWEDVLAMLPILQSHQMNFFHPLGGETAFKGYGMVTPIIYQYGAEIYTEDGVGTTLKDPTTVAAIKFMTDLFTIYDLPLQVSSFFEHFRSGDIPIGISTVDLYLQLKYAAPELSGQWGVSVIPGMDMDANGTVVRYASAYGKASILFQNSDQQDEGWELIKWWNSTQTQISFMQQVKTNLGEKFLVISANMDALEASVWDEEIKDPMLEQALWARTPAVTPGSYIVERELSNIWNKVVIDLMDVSVAINESIPRIARELNRKFEEFGYRTSTDPSGREYIVAMNENIHLWIGDDDDD